MGAHVVQIVLALIAASGAYAGYFFRKQYLANVRKGNADAAKGEADAGKSALETLVVDASASKLYREELTAVLLDLKEWRRQNAEDRAAERAEAQRRSDECTERIRSLEKKLDETLAAHEIERQAWNIRESELLAIIQKSDERHRGIKHSLQGIEEQMKLDAEIQARRQTSIEQQLQVLWKTVEKNGGPPSHDPPPQD